MQSLDGSIIREAKKFKLKQIESEFKETIEGLGPGMNLCPKCQYVGPYSPKGSMKIFKDGSAKCFACGIWRRI